MHRCTRVIKALQCGQRPFRMPGDLPILRARTQQAHTLATVTDLKWHISTAPTPPSTCGAYRRAQGRAQVMSAQHVRSDSFVCQSIYPSYKHTQTHTASAHLSCTSRLEAAHFGGSEGALDLQCVRVQISKGMHIEALLSGIKVGTYAEDVGRVYLL